MEIRGSMIAMVAALAAIGAGAAQAGVEHSVVGVGGYDLVSYHTGGKPLPGSGHHLSEVDGVVYLFVSEENKERFDADPARFLPAYGGYCAYGVSVGKKFVGDPTVWEIVDGRLYLNLDNEIQGLWTKDVPGHIRKADERWEQIRSRHFSAL